MRRQRDDWRCSATQLRAERDDVTILLARRINEITELRATVSYLTAEADSWKGIAAEMASDMATVATTAREIAARWAQ